VRCRERSFLVVGTSAAVYPAARLVSDREVRRCCHHRRSPDGDRGKPVGGHRTVPAGRKILPRLVGES